MFLYISVFPKTHGKRQILMSYDSSFVLPRAALTEYHPSFSEAAKKKERRETV